MRRLSKHEKYCTIGMLKAWFHVTDIAQYYICHPSTIQVLRDRCQATGTVKDRHWSGQTRITIRHPDATLTAFFAQWHNPLCVKSKGEQKFIDRHDNAPAHTARLSVSFQAANKMLVLVRPPLSYSLSNSTIVR